VVSIEHAYPLLPVDVVGPAQAVDVMRAMDRLWQLGHRRIGYTADNAARGNRLPQTLRFAGYLSALRRLGVEYRPEDVLGIPGPAVPREELEEAVRARVKAGVTALVCSTDRQAYLLCKELAAHKVQVPQHLSVIGFGGVTPLEGMPQLTMYRTPYETLGLAAIERLRDRRRQPGAATPVVKEYPGTFIEGTSVAPPPRASSR
jgi:DNA-binding LacI/PurR family transcriptional regulator